MTSSKCPGSELIRSHIPWLNMGISCPTHRPQQRTAGARPLTAIFVRTQPHMHLNSQYLGAVPKRSTGTNFFQNSMLQDSDPKYPIAHVHHLPICMHDVLDNLNVHIWSHWDCERPCVTYCTSYCQSCQPSYRINKYFPGRWRCSEASYWRAKDLISEPAR
jgi:hypothetical protein